MAWKLAGADTRIRRMNNISLRWLFVAVAAFGLAVSAILNANPLWEAAADFIRVALIGLAILYVVYRKRQAPFAIGYAVFALLLRYLPPNFDLDFYAHESRTTWQESGVVFSCLSIAFGCAGGVISSHFADVTARRMALTMWLAIIVLFAAVVIGVGIVEVRRPDPENAETGQQSTNGFGGGPLFGPVNVETP